MKFRWTAILVTDVFLATAAAQSGPAAAGDILTTLRSGHPRLMALDSDIQRIRQMIESDEEARRLRDALRKSGEALLSAPPVEHRLVGPRLLQQSRRCMDRVYTLGLLYRLDGDERWARRAEKEMLTAAAFPDWNPKHFLDTAEMTHALGVGYDWLYSFLSPESRAKIRNAIVELGLKPAQSVYEKKGWWSVGTNNWNQVCNGGITVGALAVADEAPELARYVLERARDSIRIPTARLAPDGGWDEGPGYWNYAMSYTAYYLAATQTALGTDFGLHEMPGMAETGMFRIHFTGPTRLTFNFADGGAGAGNAPAMMLMARLYDRPVYAWHERQIMRGAPAAHLLWYDPRGSAEDLAALPLSAFFKNIDVVFMRSAWRDPDAFFVGFKGGNNRASHGHLDLGTFVLDALGQRWAVDLGGDDYNMPGYFGGKRWTYYRLRTEGQNTLLIDGANQDLNAVARIVAFKPQPGAAFAVADLSAAYAASAKRVRRGIALLDARHVLIQDDIEAQRPLKVEWVMHTPAEAKVSADTAVLQLNGRRLSMRAICSTGGSWRVQEPKLDPPQRPLKGTRRLTFEMNVPATGTRLQILIAPFGEAEVKLPTGSVEAWPQTMK